MDIDKRKETLTQLKRESKSYESFQEGMLLALLNMYGYSFSLKRPERMAEKTYQYITIVELFYKENPLRFGEQINDFCEKQFLADKTEDLTSSQLKIVKRRKDLNRTALSFSWLIKFAEHHGAVFEKRKTKVAKKTVQLEKITALTIPQMKKTFKKEHIEQIGKDIQQHLCSLFSKEEKILVVPAHYHYFESLLEKPLEKTVEASKAKKNGKEDKKKEKERKPREKKERVTHKVLPPQEHLPEPVQHIQQVQNIQNIQNTQCTQSSGSLKTESTETVQQTLMTIVYNNPLEYYGVQQQPIGQGMYYQTVPMYYPNNPSGLYLDYQALAQTLQAQLYLSQQNAMWNNMSVMTGMQPQMQTQTQTQMTFPMGSFGSNSMYSDQSDTEKMIFFTPREDCREQEQCGFIQPLCHHC